MEVVPSLFLKPLFKICQKEMLLSQTLGERLKRHSILRITNLNYNLSTHKSATTVPAVNRFIPKNGVFTLKPIFRAG